MNIPAIETGVLPPLDSYLDRDNNIPPEDGDQPPPPLPVETDPIWHQGVPGLMCQMFLMMVVGMIPNPLLYLHLLG